MRFLLALMLTECHKPSFKSLPVKNTGRTSVVMIDSGRFAKSKGSSLACYGPRTYLEWTLSSFCSFPGVIFFFLPFNSIVCFFKWELNHRIYLHTRSQSLRRGLSDTLQVVSVFSLHACSKIDSTVNKFLPKSFLLINTMEIRP